MTSRVLLRPSPSPVPTITSCWVFRECPPCQLLPSNVRCSNVVVHEGIGSLHLRSVTCEAAVLQHASKNERVCCMAKPTSCPRLQLAHVSRLQDGQYVVAGNM